MTGLFCEACLKLEIEEYFAAFAREWDSYLNVNHCK